MTAKLSARLMSKRFFYDPFCLSARLEFVIECASAYGNAMGASGLLALLLLLASLACVWHVSSYNYAFPIVFLGKDGSSLINPTSTIIPVDYLTNI